MTTLTHTHIGTAMDSCNMDRAKIHDEIYVKSF